MHRLIRQSLGIVCLSAIVGASTMLASSSVEAYDRDTHFFATYIMARHAGFNHEYSSFLATGAQWVDEAVTSTPMGGLILGTTMRRLNHFPAFRIKLSAKSHGSSAMNGLTEAEFNHPTAHRLIWKGMVNRNWLMAALSIHVIQDTAGHAGFPAELGHAWAGHHPDRPWLEPAKYREMMDLVFEALVALRRLAPNEALEPAYQKYNKQPVAADDAAQLAESLWSKTGFKEIVTRNIFKSIEYSKPATEYIIAMAQQNGHIKANVDLLSILPTDADYIATDGTIKEPAQVLKDWVLKIRQQEVQQGKIVEASIFNLNILDQLGHQQLRLALEVAEKIPDATARNQRIASLLHGDQLRKEIIESIVTNLTRGFVPKAFNDKHKTEAEVEGPIRAMEAAMREYALRLFILENWQNNINFEANTVFEKVTGAIARKPKVSDNPLLNPKAEEPQRLRQTDVEIVTMSRADRYRAFYINVSNIVHSWATEILPNLVNSKLGRPLRIVDKNVKSYQIADLFNMIFETGKVGPMGTLDERTKLGNNAKRSGADEMIDPDAIDHTAQSKAAMCAMWLGKALKLR